MAQVEILEVGPRDGLQNEPGVVPTATKIELIERMIAAGLRRIEVASFVNPARVPQMADAEEVLRTLPRRRRPVRRRRAWRRACMACVRAPG